VKASAAVWLARLGLAQDQAAALGSNGHSQSGAVTNRESLDGDSKDATTGSKVKGGDGEVSDEIAVSAAHAQSNGKSHSANAETTTAIATSVLINNNNTHNLTEWVGQYLQACWEDYSRQQNRKRKA